MDKEFMSQLHMLSSDLHRELITFIESKKAEVGTGKTFEDIVRYQFWNYVRSCSNHTANNPHFMTYLHHAYAGSNNIPGNIHDSELRKVFDGLLLPGPKHCNKGLLDYDSQGGGSYWDYSDKCEESDDIKNWGA